MTKENKKKLILILKLVDMAIMLALFIIGVVKHDIFYLLSAIVWDLLGSNSAK